MRQIPDGWATVKLRKIATNIKTKNRGFEIRTVFTNSAINGIIIQDEFFDREITSRENLNGYTIVEPYDFVYNPRVSINAPFGPINANETGISGLVSPLYTVFRIDSKKCDINYMMHYFKSNHWHKYLYSISNVGARHDRMSITIEDFFNMPILLPPIEEQRKITEILSSFDYAINTQIKLISKKKTFLENLVLLLVKNKKSLTNFQTKWKNTSLDLVFSDRREYGFENEKLKLYSLTIEGGVTEKTERYDREFLVKSDRKRYKISKYNDLVFNPQNLRYGAIAVNKNIGEVLISPIYATLEIKDKTKYDIDYFGHLLTNSEIIRFYDSIAEGTLVERMTVRPDVFLKQEFLIPGIDEQNMISKLLNQLAYEITILEVDLELKKKQKSAYLQKLLVGKVKVNKEE